MAHPNIHFSTCAHRRGREKGALTPIRRPRTPQTLPHMLPSGTEFGAGHAVRMPPRTSAAAAVGRQRGPPRIGSENSPRGRQWQSPELRSAVAASNAADVRARPPGVRRRIGAEAPAAGCASRGHRSSARDGTWRASRQPRGERGAARPAAVPEQPLGGSGRAYLSVHVQRELQAYGPWQTCESKGCGLQPCCAQQKKAQQRAATR